MPSDFVFYTDSISYGVETKDNGEKVPYVQGYISTEDIDLYNDVVTSECLDDMLMQIKSGNVKLDIEHEAWRKSSRIIPAGRIIDARRDIKGLWVKAIINKHSPAFKTIWGSIKDGFIDAFSIAYKAVKTQDEIVNGVKARLLQKVQLLNVALTGNPVNQECKMQAVFMKSIQSASEGDIMSEEKGKKEVSDDEEDAETEKKKCDSSKEKKSIDELVKQLEAQKEEIAELKAKVEESAPKEKEQPEEKSLEDLAEALEIQKKEFAELKAKLEKSVLKAQVEEKSLETTEFKPTNRQPLELIR